MSNIVLFNDYRFDTMVEDPEQFGLLLKYMETFYNIAEKYDGIKYEYDVAKYQFEQMLEKANAELGLKSIKGRDDSVTFVPGTEGRTEEIRVLNEAKVLELLDELGIDSEEFYKTEIKTVGKRKASIRYKQ